MKPANSRTLAVSRHSLAVPERGFNQGSPGQKAGLTGGRPSGHDTFSTEKSVPPRLSLSLSVPGPNPSTASARGAVLGIVLLLLTCALGPLHAQTNVVVTTNSLGELVFTNGFGDLNNDGNVDVLDVIRLTSHLTNTQPLPPALAPRADLNQDGKITDADRAILIDMILRLRVGADDDFDNDDLSNADELRLGLNPFNPDMDGDGWPDGVEVADGTDPRNPNSHPSLTIIASPPVVVELPSAQATASGLSAVVARPPVQIELVGTESAAGAQGIVLARPPVQVELPGVEAAAGAGLVLAEPPIQIELAGTEASAGAQGTTLAQPPVQIELPGAEGATGAQGTTLAQPPVQIELPGVEGLGIGGVPLFLAEPPIQIEIAPP